jgi:hypothetical protein
MSRGGKGREGGGGEGSGKERGAAGETRQQRVKRNGEASQVPWQGSHLSSSVHCVS